MMAVLVFFALYFVVPVLFVFFGRYILVFFGCLFGNKQAIHDFGNLCEDQPDWLDKAFPLHEPNYNQQPYRGPYQNNGVWVFPSDPDYKPPKNKNWLDQGQG